MKGQIQNSTDALEKRMAATTNVLQQDINEINNLLILPSKIKNNDNIRQF